MRIRPTFFVFLAPALLPLASACVTNDDTPPPPAVDSGSPSFDGGAQDRTSPDVAAPDSSLPDAAPDTTVPDTGIPDVTLPDVVLPDVVLPDVVLPDVVLPDVAIDVQVDAGVLPVVMTVLAGATPEQGINVVFSDASGAFISATVTDVNGVAAGFVPAGSMVTVLLGDPTAPRLATTFGVEPGDILTTFDADKVFNLPSQSVSVPAFPTGALFTQIFATIDCNATLPGTGTLAVQGRCTNGVTFPALVIGRDDSFVETGYTYAKGNVFTPGGLGDGGTASITLPGAFLVPITTTLSLVNPPPFASQSVAFIAYSEIADGIPYSQQKTSALPNTDPVTSNFVAHVDYPDFVQAETGTEVDVGVTRSISEMATRFEPPTTPGVSLTLDLSSLLPLVTSATLNGGVARPDPSWTVDVPDGGTPPALDGVAVAVTWLGSLSDGGTQSGSWVFIAPPDSTGVVAPELPAALADWAPVGSSTFGNPPNVAIMEGSFIASYAEFRRFGASLPATVVTNFGTSFRPMLPPLTADGTLRASVLLVNNL